MPKKRNCSHCKNSTKVQMCCAGDSTMYLCPECQQEWWNFRDDVVKGAVAKFTSSKPA